MNLQKINAMWYRYGNDFTNDYEFEILNILNDLNKRGIPPEHIKILSFGGVIGNNEEVYYFLKSN